MCFLSFIYFKYVQLITVCDICIYLQIILKKRNKIQNQIVYLKRLENKRKLSQKQRKKIKVQINEIENINGVEK